MLILTYAEIDVTNLAGTIQMSIATQRSIEDFEAQQNVAKVKEHMVDEKIENLVEGTENTNLDDFLDTIFTNQEEPDNRIDHESYNESPKLDKALQSTMKEVPPSMVGDQVNDIAQKTDDEKLRNDDLSIWWSLKIKFDKPAPSAALCKTAAILPRVHDDHYDDAHLEGGNNA
nr:hypothetical protein [Tanacetum cinerariifolium]